jgi:hypothetical protein
MALRTFRVSLGSLDMSDVAVERTYDWGSWKQKANVNRSITAFDMENGATHHLSLCCCRNSFFWKKLRAGYFCYRFGA